MSLSGRPWTEIRTLAKQLVHGNNDPQVVEALRTDLVTAIRGRGDVHLIHQAGKPLVTGCRIGGAYVRRRPPKLPCIVVGDSDDIRRDRFSIGHEFCHHLVDHDPYFADLLFAEPDQGHALEEDLCDSGAAYLLVRGRHVDEVLANQGQVTVEAVRQLYAMSNGSVEVCCIALSYRMTEPGHILVCTPHADDPTQAIVRLHARASDDRPTTTSIHTPILEAVLRGPGRG